MRNTPSDAQRLPSPSVCTIMKLLAAGPDGRSSRDGRKVRTPQSSVPDNVREGPRAGRRNGEGLNAFLEKRKPVWKNQ